MLAMTVHAVINRTGIIVSAILRLIHTDTVHAFIIGALIIVIALFLFVLAMSMLIAKVIGAGIIVAAINRGCEHANTVQALIRAARVVVVA